MDGKTKLRAIGLAVGMVASAAGTGWALQLPLTAMVADLGSIDVPTPADMPVPGLSLSTRPQPVTRADEPAPLRAQALGTEESVGLEEMSATGAAFVRQ